MPGARALGDQSIIGAKIPATSSLKGKVMESLDCEKTLTTKALSSKLGLHQSSVSHAPQRDDRGGPGHKNGQGLRPKQSGQYPEEYPGFDGKNLGCIKDHRDFILSHDLSGISPGLHLTMGVIWDGQMTIENDPAIPSRHHKIILPLFSQARHFQAASSTLVPEHQLATALAVR